MKSVAYVMLFVIVAGVGFFAIITNNRFKNQHPVEKIESNLSEDEIIEIIFEEELFVDKNPE